MNYANMCLGSETRDPRPPVDLLTTRTTRLCPSCDSWVTTGVPSSRLVPVHEKPYTEAEERDFEARAAAVIRWEYSDARRRGTLLRDPYRSHVTALAFVRPRKHLTR